MFSMLYCLRYFSSNNRVHPELLGIKSVIYHINAISSRPSSAFSISLYILFLNFEWEVREIARVVGLLGRGACVRRNALDVELVLSKCVPLPFKGAHARANVDRVFERHALSGLAV